MIRLLLRRAVYMLATIFLATLAIFALFEFDHDSLAVNALGQYSTEAQRALWLTQRGYDAPAHVRYFAWLERLASGDLGQSRTHNAPVAKVIGDRIGNSAILAAAFFAVLIPLSIGLGVLAGTREGSVTDRTISILSILTTSVPPFASGILVSAVLVFWLDLVPGTSSMIDGFDARELIMPVLVLLIYDFGYVTRITRASVAEVMTTAYVRTAELKGIAGSTLILRHVLRNALIAPFTIIMLQVNWVVGGIVVVEFMFAYKGFGSLILEASLSQDAFLLQACVILTVLLAVTTQTLADLGYVLLNPRIRFR